MVSAMTPLRPLSPQKFRLAQLVSLAYLHQVVHQFLVSTSERFRLRLYVLGRGFGLATRFLLASTRRITGGAPPRIASGTRCRRFARTSRRSPTSRWSRCARC
jgi:hypothetical protein